MADILSQDELEALLGQMQGDDDDDDEEPDPFAEDEPIEEAVPESIAQAVAQPDPVALEEEDLDDEPIAWDATEGPDPDVNVKMILDIPVRVNVELGRAQLTVGDLLALGQGSVIELDALANDLLDLTVNKKVVAQGEAVVVNENFGVRVIEVDSVRERIKKL